MAPARHQKFKTRWHINELKPVIPSRCIGMATNEGDVILDPFGGGGSSYVFARAARQRVAVGFTLLPLFS
jgi:site-specific DNA-methyltransferase (adenine-specific)